MQSYHYWTASSVEKSLMCHRVTLRHCLEETHSLQSVWTSLWRWVNVCMHARILMSLQTSCMHARTNINEFCLMHAYTHARILMSLQTSCMHACTHARILMSSVCCMHAWCHEINVLIFLFHTCTSVYDSFISTYMYVWNLRNLIIIITNNVIALGYILFLHFLHLHVHVLVHLSDMHVCMHACMNINEVWSR